ncbi:hypothetical protein CBR_g32422 [Chara braunii]|uniref:Pirin-like protein n=1 Tax=Chara braunii TaxID=69332 RepID=A0A388JYJ3_CHABU|nr:hypothetical protein CBR_g32422 [Chara braunii]|eukprot:GBG62837.1 hypothetical protein CBR_g32422 [Chara braunii]
MAVASASLLSTMPPPSLPFKDPRVVDRKLSAREIDEGVMRVRRGIGMAELRTLDPFLLLDEVKGKAPAGFPDHPHRGFQTVTYVLKGSVVHEDFQGRQGTIRDGDVQWMTAGRGIVHSEMIGSAEEETHAFQLWVNLAAKDKLMAPSYQEIQAKDIPVGEARGVKVVVIAGTAFGVTSPVFTQVPMMFLDFNLEPGWEMHQPVPAGWSSFIYIISGFAIFGANRVKSGPHCTLVLGPGDGITVRNEGREDCRFLLVGGSPLREPIAQSGPFVMNTKDELRTAFLDYQYGRNGFQKASQWRSRHRQGGS